jgi:pimeloyl-ACP methyl ester carboxylesterase
MQNFPMQAQLFRRALPAHRFFLGFALVAALLRPACAAVPWAAPPTTAVSTKSVVFKNGDATLRGTLYLPASRRKVPAIVVFHGASEPLANTPLYRHVRDALPQLGVAVLLFDRRGSGASSGSRDVSYETLADDGIAGARALRQMPQIDATRVGYWGISQGGWLATFAAVRDAAAAFAVAVSAPLVTPESQMQFAMSNRLQVLGYGAADVDAMLYARRMRAGYLRGTNSYAEAVAAIAKIEQRPWFDLMYPPTAQSLPKNPADSSWKTQMDDDPIVAVERVKIPILFILGAEDPWIPVATTVAHLREVARTHPLLQYVVVPNANHLMMLPPVPERMEDADPKMIASDVPTSPAYFMLLGAWLQRTLGR